MTKTCFIISSIGKEGTPERENADEKLNHLFIPVLNDLGYSCIRADQEESAGSISRAIVERVINSEMAIADISDQNPNVFYEIAIRNAVLKPLIIIRSSGQKPPFDIQDTRAIAVDMSKPNIWRPAMDILKKQIESAEKDPKKASESILSDFSFSIESETKEDKESVLLRTMKDIQGQLRGVVKDVRPKPPLRLDLPFIEPLRIPPLIIPDHVKCKKCKSDFSVTVLFGTIANKTEQTEKCPTCNHSDNYSYNEMFHKGL